MLGQPDTTTAPPTTTVITTRATTPTTTAAATTTTAPTTAPTTTAAATTTFKPREPCDEHPEQTFYLQLCQVRECQISVHEDVAILCDTLSETMQFLYQ